MEIIKENAMDAWVTALKQILRKGNSFKDSNGRTCHELRGMKIEVLNGYEVPAKKLANSTLWIYPLLDELKNSILYTQDSAEYTYSYSKALFNYEGKNQIDDYIIPLLKKQPNSRQVVCVIWNPSETTQKTVPGLVAIDFKLREGKLYLTAFIRSQDMFFGWPANTYQLYELQKYVKNKIKVELGSITTFATSAHIFEEQIGEIKKIISKN